MYVHIYFIRQTELKIRRLAISFNKLYVRRSQRTWCVPAAPGLTRVTGTLAAPSPCSGRAGRYWWGWSAGAGSAPGEKTLLKTLCSKFDSSFYVDGNHFSGPTGPECIAA